MIQYYVFSLWTKQGLVWEFCLSFMSGEKRRSQLDDREEDNVHIG